MTLQHAFSLPCGAHLIKGGSELESLNFRSINDPYSGGLDRTPRKTSLRPSPLPGLPSMLRTRPFKSAEWVERVERAGCATCLRLCLKLRQYGRPLHTGFLTRANPVVHLKFLCVSLRSLAFMYPASIYIFIFIHTYIHIHVYVYIYIWR